MLPLLQNGSGIDQGYRALAGYHMWPYFSTLTALRRTDLPLPLTSSGSCIRCLLDRESFGYEKPGPGDCWMQLFRDIVYKGSCLVLYLFFRLRDGKVQRIQVFSQYKPHLL